MCFFLVFLVSIVTSNHKFQLIRSCFYHVPLCHQGTIRRFRKIRHFATPLAAQTDNGAIILIIGKNLIALLGHTVEVVSNGTLIGNPACSGGGPIVVEPHQHLHTLNFQHLASQHSAQQGGLFPIYGHRTNRISQRQMVFQQVAITGDSTPNNRIGPQLTL